MQTPASSIRLIVLASGLWWCAVVKSALGADPEAVVSIDLKPASTASVGIVEIGDIARVSGGDPALRSRIAGLDVCELTTEREHEEITRTRLALRLALAGFQDEQYRINGARQARLSLTVAASPENAVVNVVQREVAVRFGVPEDDVRVRLTRPLPSRFIAELQSGDAVRPDVLLPDVVRLGDQSVAVQILSGPALRSSWPVSVSIELQQDVLTATRPLSSGTVVSAQDVALQRRFASTVVERLSPEDVIGMATRTTLYPGEMLSRAHLAVPRRKQVEPIVKARDIVQLIARINGLTVHVSAAEVLESGAEGDLVRIRNSRSREIIVGRIVSAELVEVPLLQSSFETGTGSFDDP